MRKLFLLLIICAVLVGCVSTGSGGFVTTYDEITGTTEIIHSDLQPGAFYNLRDNIAGEREHIMMYKLNDTLVLGVWYQYKKWAFFHTAVFLADGERYEIKLGKGATDIVTGTVLRERYAVPLSAENVARLRSMLASDNCGVAFIGDNYTTDKFTLSEKIRAAMLATLDL